MLLYSVVPAFPFFTVVSIVDSLQTGHQVGIMDGIFRKDNQFSIPLDISIPVPQAGDPTMLSFDSFDKQLQIIVSTRKQGVVITGEQPFPKSLTVSFEVVDKRLIKRLGKDGFRFVEVPRQLLFHTLTGLMRRWFQDSSDIKDPLMPTDYESIVLSKTFHFAYNSVQLLKQRSPLFYPGISQGTVE